MWAIARVGGQVAKNYYNFNPVFILQKCVVYSSIELCIVLLGILCVSQYWAIYVYNVYSTICILRIILVVKIMLNDLVSKDRLGLHRLVVKDQLDVFEFTLNQLSFIYFIKLCFAFIEPLLSHWVMTGLIYIFNIVLVVIAIDYIKTYNKSILYIATKSYTMLKTNRELAFFTLVYTLEFIILCTISLF